MLYEFWIFNNIINLSKKIKHRAYNWNSYGSQNWKFRFTHTSTKTYYTMTKNTWNQAKEENGQTQFRRTSLLFLLSVICLRSLVAEASKDFLGYISRSTELCTCLLYLKEFFSSFSINCCPLFFRFLVDISQFVFYFLSILCLLCIEFFLLYKRVVKCLLIKWFYRW